MSWSARIAAACLALASSASVADLLYVASSPAVPGDNPQRGGVLHAISLPQGPVRRVGEIRVGGTTPITVAGLAVQPITNALYGITPDSSPNHPRSLVTIDTATANATVVGDLGAAGTDIAFDGHGTLFIWLRGSSQIGTVSLSTGEARPVGRTRIAGETGGITVDNTGRIFVMSTGPAGSVDQVDSITGKIRRGPALSGVPFPAAINAIAMAPGGALLAVNTDRGTPSRAALVKVDPSTGLATQMSALPDDSEAIALLAAPSSAATYFSSRAGITLTVVIAILAAAAAALAFVRRARRRGAGGDARPAG